MSRSTTAGAVVSISIGAAAFLVAYLAGGYGLTTRAVLAIVLWWCLMVGLALGLTAPLPRGATLVAGLFGGFAVWTLASTLWSANAERSFDEFNRVSLYLAVLLFPVLWAGRVRADRWADGLLLGLGGTSLVALASRVFPDLVADRELAILIPSAASRLSYPVGYWNGLGILTSLALPLCFRAALVSRTASARAFAVAAVPLLSAVVYLTASRGAVVTAVLGTIVFVLATDRRWAALGVIAAGTAGTWVAVGWLLQQSALVNGPMDTELAASQGRRAAVVLVGCAIGSALLSIAGGRILGHRFTSRNLRARSVLAVLAFVAIVAVAFGDLGARLESFRQMPAIAEGDTTDFATAHLLSGNGSGRWQFWGAAVDQFQSAPLRGQGAGSYESWWAEHGSFSYFVQNAHSFYFEVLGELGLVGVMLATAAFASGLVLALTRLPALFGSDRITLAALLAVIVAFLAGLGLDWIWQLTALGIIGFIALGAALSLVRPEVSSGSPSTARQVARVAALALVPAVILAQAIPWLTASKIADSQAAARRGDTGAALAEALDARALKPWGSSPRVQLALVAEERGDLAAAREWMDSAIARDPRNWRLWFLASRIQAASGLPAAATSSYERARALNPRSPLFARG